jgi:hypothetical protein
VLGIFLAGAFSAIVKRTIDWQAAYIDRVRYLQEKGQELFVEGMVGTGPKVMEKLRSIQRLAVTTWILFIVLVLVAKLTHGFA